MGTPKNKKPKSTDPPEQKLGDTPVPPWEMPTPEEKAQAKPVRRALKKVIANVDSQEKADEMIGNLEADIGGETAKAVEQAQRAGGATLAEAARQVEKAAETAPNGKKMEKVLETTARVLATPDRRQREVVSEAVQEVFDPEQQGATTIPDARQREYLREAVLKRLKPLDALDANLFLAVNHLPHTRFLNTVFYGLTIAFNGAAGWFALMGLAVLRKPRAFRDLFWDAAVPLTITTALVEYPIKAYFKRRRPFITIIQAIVIGKKPGTWSFPSGHAAAAFGGAWLLNRKSPQMSPIRYILAGWVAFSRVYLGDHYPGDVVSGSVCGILFAMLFNKLGRWWRKRQ